MAKCKNLSLALLITTLLMMIALPVSAQDEEYQVSWRRLYGYGEGINVRGQLSISIKGDVHQVAAVEFFIDDELMTLVEEAPFSFQFHTDQYGFGLHLLRARVTLHDGREETTAAVHLNFITPEAEKRILALIFGGLGAILVFSLAIYGLVLALGNKRRPRQSGEPGKPGSYGLSGAAICPRCGRPFPRHIWGINMIVGKFDRCEHCGKWSITRRATPQELSAAEEALLPSQETTAEEKPVLRGTKNSLDDTRYVDKI